MKCLNFFPFRATPRSWVCSHRYSLWWWSPESVTGISLFSRVGTWKWLKNKVQFHVKIPPLHGPPSRHVAVVTGKWVVVSDVRCQISFRMEWQPFTLLPYMVRQRLYRSFSLGPLILPRSSVRWGTNNCYSSLCDFLTFLRKLTDWWAWKITFLVSLYDKLFDDFQFGETFCAFFMYDVFHKSENRHLKR